MFKTLAQEEDRGSNRRRSSPGEPGVFMMMDTWKIFNAFMRKEAMKGLRVPLERNPWRFPESQVQAVKKKRNLLFSVRIGLLCL